MDEKPQDVVAALAAVMGDLGGISKMTPEERRRKGLAGSDERGVSYAYRGIDQIAAAVQPLLAKYGVVIVPHVTACRVEEITINGKPWSDTFMTVNWLIAGPNNSRLDGCTEGMGRDNSDKGANKAMTSAYKNLLLRLLCIGDPSDDTDGTTHERDAVQEPQFSQAVIDLFERVKQAKGTDHEVALKQAAAENNMSLSKAGLAGDQMWADIVTAILNDPQPVKEASNG